MNATARKPLRQIIFAALPNGTPRGTARRLTAALLLQIREWRADQRHRPTFDAPKVIAEQEGLLKVSDSTRRALQRARRRIGLSREFQTAVDDAVERLRDEVTDNGIMQSLKSAFPEFRAPDAPPNPYSVGRSGALTGHRNELTPGEQLDIHLAHCLAALREWNNAHRHPGHRQLLESTRLANDLYSIAQRAGLSRMEICDLLDALNGSSGLPAFSVETVQRSRDGAKQRERTLSVKSQG